MKVCILSMQEVINFGSVLQAYALKKILIELGHDVTFIPIKSSEEDNKLMQNYNKSYEKEYGNNTGLMGKISKVDKYFLNRINGKKQRKKQEEYIVKFQKNVLNLSTDSLNEHYDVCVIGSDEVFNCLNATNWGFTSQLFGNVPQADKIITYAASCGYTTYENVPELALERIADSFRKISSFSVRDKNTQMFVKRITGRSLIDLHFDPVIIETFKEEAESARPVTGLLKRYCVVYAYYNRIHSKSEISAITSFCKKNKLELVSVGSPQMWIKHHIVAEPFQIPDIFAKASFVITDTFHGTIFASKFSKHFSVIIRESNNNKLTYLLKTLNIEKHQLKNLKELEDIFKMTNDINYNNEISLKAREDAMRYLTQNL